MSTFTMPMIEAVLGGLIFTDGVTNANFYSMVEVFLFIAGEYVLRHMEVMRDEQALRRGKDYVDGKLVVRPDH